LVRKRRTEGKGQAINIKGGEEKREKKNWGFEVGESTKGKTSDLSEEKII